MTVKKCGRCLELKQLIAFSKDKSKKDGLQSYCKECASSTHADYSKLNSEYVFNQKKKWREMNKERLVDQKKTYYTNNKDSYLVRSARRRAVKLQATTSWDEELTNLVVQEAYHLTKLREKATGFTWHVDHVIPLQGKSVCGLHVWNNLAVIPASENLSKNNSYVME